MDSGEETCTKITILAKNKTVGTYTSEDLIRSPYFESKLSGIDKETSLNVSTPPLATKCVCDHLENETTIDSLKKELANKYDDKTVGYFLNYFQLSSVFHNIQYNILRKDHVSD